MAIMDDIGLICGIPQLVYTMSILDVPTNCIPTINTSIFLVHLKKKER